MSMHVVCMVWAHVTVHPGLPGDFPLLTVVTTGLLFSLMVYGVSVSFKTLSLILPATPSS